MPGIASLFGALTGSSIGSVWPANAAAAPAASAMASGAAPAPPFKMLPQPESKPPTSLPRGSLLDLTV